MTDEGAVTLIPKILIKLNLFIYISFFRNKRGDSIIEPLYIQRRYANRVKNRGLKGFFLDKSGLVVL
jgi:hypothetical protein